MTDYSEQGAIPVEDAVADDPPTEDEVRDAQDHEYPEQAATRQEGERPSLPHDDDRPTRSPAPTDG
jgi:hypothetical protein